MERRNRSKKKYARAKGGSRMKNLPQVQLNTRISPQTWTALDEHSKKTGESKASIVDAAIREYLEKRKNSK
jgi:predicted DNA-binding protein